MDVDADQRDGEGRRVVLAVQRSGRELFGYPDPCGRCRCDTELGRRRRMFHRLRLRRLQWVVGHAEHVGRDTAGRRERGAVGSGGGPAPAGHLLGGARRLSGGSGLLVRRLGPGAVHGTAHHGDGVRVQPARAHDRRGREGLELLRSTTFAGTWASTGRAGSRGAWLPSCPARRRSPPAPPGCAATRSFRRPPITAALAPPTCPPRGSPTLHRPTSGPAPTSLPMGPISRSSRATARTTTNRPESLPSSKASPSTRPRSNVRPRLSDSVATGSRSATKASPSTLHGIPDQPLRSARSSQAGASCSTPMGGRWLPGRGSMMVGR